MSYASITAFQKYSFSEKDINEARKSIGRLLVQHTTVGAYTETEDIRAEENRRLRLFEADRASACGVRLSPLPNLHSLTEDIDTQMSANHYLDLLALGAATDALRLGLVVLWVQSKDDPDEYAVYYNDMVGSPGNFRGACSLACLRNTSSFRYNGYICIVRSRQPKHFMSTFLKS